MRHEGSDHLSSPFLADLYRELQCCVWTLQVRVGYVIMTRSLRQGRRVVPSVEACHTRNTDCNAASACCTQHSPYYATREGGRTQNQGLRPIRVVPYTHRYSLC